MRRCHCGSIFDYIYHTLWKCRDCGRWWERVPVDLDQQFAVDFSDFDWVAAGRELGL